MTFKQEFFSESTVQPAPDLVCCKMTLEHIFETRRFVQAVRRICSPERGTITFFQVPDVRRILGEAAFWDVYYEHCAYFSPTSLAQLFRNAGFEILRTSTGFDAQYLTIEARPATTKTTIAAAAITAEAADELASNVAHYRRGRRPKRGRLGRENPTRSFGRADVPCFGDPAPRPSPSFRPLELDQEIEYLVDINPYRQGKFVPGTGKQIVGPEIPC